jgi:hypothetical protein
VIQSIFIGPIENHLNDNADVTVTLRDGRTYSFTAFTPLNLMTLMNQESSAYFLCEDMLVLHQINEANVRAAVEEMLEDDNIDRFGILAED